MDLELAGEQSAEHDCRKLPAVVADAAGGWQRREEQGRLLLCRQGLVTLLKGRKTKMKNTERSTLNAVVSRPTLAPQHSA